MAARRVLTRSALAAAAYHTLIQDLRETAAYAALADAALPALRSLDAEDAHALGVRAAAAGLAPHDARADCARRRARLGSRVAGLEFRSPVGLAAGFDKQAEAPDALLRAGFGAVEVGTVTPLPQPGNARPRMFRLPADGAVINRFGFNSDGARAVRARLVAHWLPLVRRGMPPGEPRARGAPAGAPPRGLVGVNIGKNKDGDAAADYAAAARDLAPFADYLTVNVSSPNTAGLRALQGREQLRALIDAVRAARDALPWGLPRAAAARAPAPARGLDGDGASDVAPDFAADLVAGRAAPPPIFVKIAPDLTPSEVDDIVAVALAGGVDALIVSNTTVSRAGAGASPPALLAEAGGLSGAPLFAPSTALLRAVYARTRGRIALVGAGGVSSPAHALAKIKAGANLVQLYTALAYEGPTLVARINDGLEALLAAEGFENVADAVGADVPPGPPGAAA